MIENDETEEKTETPNSFATIGIALYHPVVLDHGRWWKLHSHGKIAGVKPEAAEVNGDKDDPKDKMSYYNKRPPIRLNGGSKLKTIRTITTFPMRACLRVNPFRPKTVKKKPV